mmetsp:Transcript_8190/g.15147  ORF Transcript_8190/g.15147 Transcript_8190/m.15147 type:complete len:492 (-) Transcript_8190:540-2015(-)
MVRWSMSRLSGQKSRNGIELALNFLNHFVSSDTNRFHGHSREPVWDHSTDKKHCKDNWGKNGYVLLFKVCTLGERTEQSKTNQAGRSNSKTLSNSSGGVSSSIKSIGLVANFFWEASHLCNSSSVITNRSVYINRKTGCKRSKHTKSSKGNSVHVQKGKTKVYNECQQEYRDDSRLVSKSKTVDNIGSSTSFTGLSHFTSWFVRVRSVVLGYKSNQTTSPKSSPYTCASVQWGSMEDFSSNVLNVEFARFTVKGPVSKRNDSNSHKECRYTNLDLQCLLNTCFTANRFQVGSNKRSNHTNNDTSSRDHQWKHNSFPSQVGKIYDVIWSFTWGSSGSNNKSSTGSLSERAEKIRSHTSNISYVITNVISNGSRVSWIILWNVVNNLSSQISTNISSLGVDTTTNTSEESNRRSSKTESSNTFEKLAVFFIEFVYRVVRKAQDVQYNQCKSTKRKSHNSTSTERSVKGVHPWCSRVHSRYSGTCVGVYSNLHA